jgi:D-alanyl-D-alanine carboxypeptidase/D-alanyl-D-alanine-endopeptidase (penicillin-binding protein 4)
VLSKLTRRSGNKALGKDLAGLVTDAATGRVLWARTPRERQLPASNAKLVTAVNALSTFGAGYRFTTTVVQGGSPGQVVLVGSGDPALSRGKLTALANAAASDAAAQGLTRLAVFVDDSLFPRMTIPRGWKRSYVPNEARAVSALVVSRQRYGDTAISAGKAFADLLKARGLKVRTKLVARQTAAPDARLIGSVRGQTLATIVGTMLRESDNDYAEALHRLVAKQTGVATTWTGAQQAQRQVLAKLGVDLGSSVLYDGSGLSRADRLTPAAVVAVLSLVFDGTHPELTSVQHGSLAIAGRTGTLGPRYKRFTTKPSRCAAGLIEAKTGSLSGVISLSGFARGADGQVKLFSFLLNRVPSTLKTRQAVDRLASTITGCW